MMLLDIANYLEDNVAALTFGTNLFASRRPTSAPDVMTAIYESNGPQDLQTFSDTPAHMPRLQVVCRAARNDYLTARQDCEDAWEVLRAVANQTIEGTVYLRIEPVGQFEDIGPDESGRPLVAANFQIWKEV